MKIEPMNIVDQHPANLSQRQPNSFRQPTLEQALGMNHTHPRRGIALLFVISLIVLFFLFATTFVAMSSSYMRSSTRRVRTARYTQFKPTHIMDDIFMMVLRDVPENNFNNPLRGQSLLADQYDLPSAGYGSFVSTASQVLPQAAYGNAVVAIECVDPTLNVDLTAPIDYSQGIHKDAMLGRWLTFIDGPCKNLTLPIIDYQSTADTTTTPGRFFVLLQPSDTQWVTTPANMTAMAGARFVVNGRPFDGFDLMNGSFQVLHRMSNEPFDGIEPVEGTPAFVDPAIGPPVPPTSAISLRNNRNLFLARNQPGNLAYTGTAEALQNAIVPSFHRYDARFQQYADQLYTEVGGAAGYTYAELEALAKTSMRPLPWENPNFTGSNDNWNFYGPGLGNAGNDYGSPFRYRYSGALAGANVSFDPRLATHWSHYFSLLSNHPTSLANLGLPQHALMDVDNDGDGIKDSIWLDLGLAPIVTPDGTRVKPLVAIQIEDMDGRVNLNTSGSLAQTNQPPTTAMPAGAIPFGQGYGPAEILTQPLGLTLTDLLLLRYGQASAGIVGSPDATLNAPRTNALVHANLMGVPETYPNYDPSVNLGSGLVGDAFGTPGDYQGQFVVAPNLSPATHVDSAGALVNSFLMPFLPHHQWQNTAGTATFPKQVAGPRYLLQYVDNPYDFDVFQGKAGSQAVVASGAGLIEQDMKLPPQMLEFLLRSYDSDARNLALGVRNQIPDPTRRDRLATFTANLQAFAGGLLGELTTNNNQKKVTTESYEVPAIPFSVAQMLRERISARRVAAGTAYTPQVLDLEIVDMLGPELVAGLPLNINRYLGNGRDDDGDFIHDEPGEAQAYEYRGYAVATATDGLPADMDRIPLDMDNDGTPSTTETEVGMRQAMAKHLYLLMLTLFDNAPANATIADLQAGTPRAAELLKFRIAVAQWAVNVVDFRDPDSICTPFEFDLDPFDGWDADGDLGTKLLDATGTHVIEGRVWGLERPELLLTESRADHQHRSSPDALGSTNHHQAHLPNPSAFFEIYNPWLVPDNLGEPVGGANQSSPKHQQVNNDLGDDALFNGYSEKAINLSKRTPNAGHPVFRVLVVRGDSRGRNADRDLNDFDQIMGDHYDSVSMSTPSFLDTDISRTVFFTDPTNLMNFVSGYTPPAVDPETVQPSPIQMALGASQHFPSHPGYSNNFLLRPGHHAVVGSAGPHDAADFMTIYGRNNTWVVNTPLDPAAGHLLNRPYIRLEPHEPVETGVFDATGGRMSNVYPNSLSVPLNATFRGTPTASPYNWSNFSVTESPAGYTVDGTGTPLDSTNNPAVAELDGWRFEVGGSYNSGTTPAGPFYNSVDMEYNRYGYDPADEEDWNRQIVLQRLANPTLDFDPINNPYITMDDLDMQITSSGGLGQSPDPVMTLNEGRYSVERGEKPATSLYGFALTGTSGTTVYPNDTSDPSTNNIWLRTLDGKWESDPMPFAADGFANVPSRLFDYSLGQTSLGVPRLEYQGNTPMTWPTFNNRPYISEAELELVPIQSNSLLLEHMVWTDNQNGTAYAEDNFYRNEVAQNDTTILENTTTEDRIPTYLPSFFGAQGSIPTQYGNLTATVTRRFSNVFEFLDVPSRFIGTQQLLDPVTFSGDEPRYLGTGGVLDIPFNPPYNWLSNRREPGKINLNTVNWPEVWRGLMGGSTAGASAYENLFQFGNLLIRRNLPGFLFSEQSSPLLSHTGQNSLWGTQDPTNLSTPSMLDLNYDDATGRYDTTTTPYFRNQGRQRLMNMTTNRSSVFAVRVTVGYFRLEVAQVPVINSASAGTPYANLTDADFTVVWKETIGQEYGIESGTNKRERAFYLIDRSIPVGFLPGENLNVEKTILLKRYIE